MEDMKFLYAVESFIWRKTPKGDWMSIYILEELK